MSRAGFDDALRRLEFLADASALLTSSLDFEKTLRTVARLAVPTLADWCLIYIVEPDGTVRRLAIEPRDPEREHVIDEVESSFRIDPDASGGVAKVVRTGEPEFHAEATEVELSVDVDDPVAMQELLRPLGIRSWICVPMIARGRTIGAISLVSTDPERRYEPLDLSLAEDLAMRAALAVDNASLFRRAQQALRQSDEALALVDALLAASPVAIAFIDPQLRYLRVNEARASMTGMQVDDFVGRTIRDVLQEEADRVEAVVRSVLETGEPARNVEIEFAHRTRPGHHVHCLATYFPVTGPDGEVAGVGVVLADITDRRTWERRLEEGNMRLQALFDNALDAIILADDDARIVDANPAACRLTGYGRDELRGMQVPRLYPHAPEDAVALWQAFIAEGSGSGGFEIARKDGSVVAAEYQAVANIVPGLHLSVLRDVTERQRVERERDQLLERERDARRDAEQHADLIALLLGVTTSLSGALTRDEVAAVVVEHGVRALGARAGAVLICEDDCRDLEVVHAKGYDPGTVAPGVRISMKMQLPVTEAIRSMAAVLVTTSDRRDERYPDLRELGITGRAFAALPLVVEGRPVGALVFHFAEERDFDAEERSFLEAVAEQCGQALERARLYDAEREAREDAERSRDLVARLQDVTAALTRTLTPRDVASVVVDAAVKTLHASCGVVVLAQGDALEIVEWIGFGRETIDRWRRFPIDAETPISDCVRQGDLVLVGSVEERNRRYPALVRESSRHQSWASVPLSGDSGPVGALGLSFVERRTFSEEELLFMRALGEQGGQAIERARLYEAEREARDQAEASKERLVFLAGASQVLSSSLEYEATLEKLVHLLVPGLADWCLVSLLEGDGMRTLALAHERPDETERIRALLDRYPPSVGGELGSGHVARTGRSELYEDVPDEVLHRIARDDEHLRLLRELGVVSAMIVPLQIRGRPLGAIALISSKPERRYTTEDLAFAEEVAQRAAHSIDNAALFQKVQETQRELLFKQALLESESEATIDGILVVSPDGKVLSYNHRFVEMWGFPQRIVEAGDDERLLSLATDRVADPDAFIGRIRYLYDHPHEEARDEIFLRDGRIFDRWSAPLVGPGQAVLGRAWYFRDVTDQKRIQQILAESKQRADFLAEASAVLASSLDHRAFLQKLADLTAQRFSDWCVVELLNDDGTVERIAVAHRDPTGRAADVEAVRRVRRRFEREANGGSHKVIRTGRWEFTPAISDEWLRAEAGGDDAYHEVLARLGIRSSITVPMIARGRAIGAITAVLAESEGAFDPADLALAQDLAYRAGSAVDNARLYEERTRVARTLQASLLPPHLPEIRGAQVGAVYEAAGEAYEVGGDFYDLFDTGGNDWAVIVGDVCGKGPDAAATTALARHTLRAAAIQARRPSRVLSTLNEVMLRADSRFCTVAYARVRRYGGHLRFTISCGGHPLPLLIRRDGRVDAVGRPGTLLGSFPQPELRDTTVDLEPGEAIVLYTDGVTEARGAGEAFGETRLRALLSGCTKYSAKEIAETVKQAVMNFQDGKPRDDIAVVALKAS